MTLGTGATLGSLGVPVCPPVAPTIDWRSLLKEGWTIPAAQIRGPEPLAARWLGKVEQRIKNSIAVDAHCIGDQQFLSPEIASAATSFFQSTSDLFRTEPYVYSSRAGDLVAEFLATKG